MDQKFNYRASFRIQPNGEVADIMPRLVEMVMGWVARRERHAPDYFKSELIWGGGKVSFGERGSNLRIATTTIDTARHWCVAYEHRDGGGYAGPRRIWRTDVGISKPNDGAAGVSVTNYYWTDSDYVGLDLNQPMLSVPNLVMHLFQNKSFAINNGEQILLNRPHYVNPGEMPRLQKMIFDPHRAVPIIYLSMNMYAPSYATDIDTLSTRLTGMACVYVALSPDCDEEMRLVFDDERYTCTSGAVRIYLPISTQNISSGRDSMRHRFFRRDDVNKLGETGLFNVLAQAVLRSAAQHKLQRHFDDPPQLEARILKIELEGKSAESDQLAQIYEQEKRDLQDTAIRLELQIDECQSTIGELEDKNRRLEIEAANARNRLKEVDGHSRGMRTALGHISNLPKSVSEATTLISHIHGDRIAITDAAFKSAQNTDYFDVASVWNALWQISTDLWDLYFDQNKGVTNLQEAFNGKSKYELSLNESSMTNKDRNLVRQREFEWRGQKYDCTPHIKLEHGKKYLRIHYAADNENRLLIINHCGDHLDTYSTRK